jgi:hypothetical protein
MSEIKISKKQIAINIYAQYKDQGRKVIIQKMVELAGLSPAGASTYTANCKNGTWKVEEAVVEVKIDPTEMLKKLSNTELVKMYNSKAETPVVRFKDKQTGITRVIKLFNGVFPQFKV